MTVGRCCRCVLEHYVERLLNVHNCQRVLQLCVDADPQPPLLTSGGL